MCDEKLESGCDWGESWLGKGSWFDELMLKEINVVLAAAAAAESWHHALS